MRVKQRDTTHEFNLASLPEVPARGITIQGDRISVKPEKILKKRAGQLSTEEKRHRDRADYSKHKNYSDAKKMEVVCAYAVSGNARRVSELTRVAEGTVRAWKTTEWWNELMDRIHQEQNEELDVKLTKLVDKAVDQINDRLDNGDYVYDARAGELRRKPVNAKDMAIVTAITLDKRQLLRGEPTARVEKVSENDKLVRLAAEFKKFAEAKQIESVALRIEEDNYASQEREVQEGHLIEYSDGDEVGETSATSDSNSNEQGGEEEDNSEDSLTVNQLFSG